MDASKRLDDCRAFDHSRTWGWSSFNVAGETVIAHAGLLCESDSRTESVGDTGRVRDDADPGEFESSPSLVDFDTAVPAVSGYDPFDDQQAESATPLPVRTGE